jgi:ParB family chromosome partitioning protein
LSAGHARALLTMAEADSIAERIVAQGLSVRDVERLAQNAAERANRKTSPIVDDKDADTRALEKSLSDVLGLLVTIAHHGDGGELRIRYKTLDQLDSVCSKLKK